MEDKRKKKNKQIQIDRGSLCILHTQTADWIFTCVWSCIMSASIFMLDSFRSLISWSRCLISSLFSTPVWSRVSHFPHLNWKHPHFPYKFSCKLHFFVRLVWSSSASLPLLAFSLIVISSSECFFLILCAFSGHPDKLVVDFQGWWGGGERKT